MGWTFTNRPKGVSNLDWFRREFCPSEPDRLIDMATKNGTAYGAFRTNEGEVIALVVLTRWVPKDYYNFGYKDMDETMGPGDDDCPRRIFDLLTPLTPGEHEWAEAWRKRVQEKLDRPKVKKGTEIHWPVNPWRGGPYGVCMYVGGRSRDMFTTAHGRIVRFRGWRNTAYEVVGA